MPDCGTRDNCPAVWNPDQTDADYDGWGAVCDCNDNNASVNPGMADVPNNGVDDDCNPGTPEQWGPPQLISEASAATQGEGGEIVAIGRSNAVNLFVALLVPLLVVASWKGVVKQATQHH